MRIRDGTNGAGAWTKGRTYLEILATVNAKRRGAAACRRESWRLVDNNSG